MSELDKLKRWLARRADDLPSPRSPVNRNWAYDWAREATAELGFPVSANRIYRLAAGKPLHRRCSTCADERSEAE